MNEQNTITIPVEDYRNLIRQSERVSAVERMIAKLKYVTVDDIKVVLDINEPVTMGADDGEL
jgi:hypothetical protein